MVWFHDLKNQSRISISMSLCSVWKRTHLSIARISKPEPKAPLSACQKLKEGKQSWSECGAHYWSSPRVECPPRNVEPAAEAGLNGSSCHLWERVTARSLESYFASATTHAFDNIYSSSEQYQTVEPKTSLQETANLHLPPYSGSALPENCGDGLLSIEMPAIFWVCLSFRLSIFEKSNI